MLQTIILNDDILSSLEYKLVLNELGITLNGTYKSWKQAIPQIKREQPDFMIVDFNLSEKETALDFLDEMDDCFVPSILVSDFSDPTLVDSILSRNVVAIIPKPLDKTLFNFHLKKLVVELKSKQTCSSYLVIKDKKRLIRIPDSKIVMIKIDGNYSVIVLESGKKFVIKMSLVKLIEKLNQDKFLRCHRSSLINVDKVRELDLDANVITLVNNIEIKIGSKYRYEIKKQLQGKQYCGNVVNR